MRVPQKKKEETIKQGGGERERMNKKKREGERKAREREPCAGDRGSRIFRRGENRRGLAFKIHRFWIHSLGKLERGAFRDQDFKIEDHSQASDIPY